MENKPQVAQAQIISFRLIPLLTHVSYRCTVPLNHRLNVPLFKNKNRRCFTLQ
jgi:hypothetical protein